jgi:D-cysteine desulfhydrase family pyridoxal phosphate-dependent enzyme
MNSIPRVKFAHLPTPVEEMPRLSAMLGGPRLMVKRDDETGLAFGGNKTRKLEFLVAEAQTKAAEMLITAGSLQSNHCRQTAAAAAKSGMKCILVLMGNPPAERSANLLLDSLFGADIVWIERREEREATLNRVYAESLASGLHPYLVPYGGSSPTGVLGYAFAIEEFVSQKVKADWIVFGSSSGGTQAGMVLGGRLFGYEGKLLGISIDEPADVLSERVAKLAADTSERLGGRIDFTPAEILVNADYCTAGYGVFGEAEREAITLFARNEGLLLDPVYTGRAAAGMIDLIRKGFFGKDETILFWHTGGTPALFAEKYQADVLSD